MFYPHSYFFISKRETIKEKRHEGVIYLLDSAFAKLFQRLLLLPSVLFGTLGVVLEEQAEGSDPE